MKAISGQKIRHFKNFYLILYAIIEFIIALANRNIGRTGKILAVLVIGTRGYIVGDFLKYSRIIRPRLFYGIRYFPQMIINSTRGYYRHLVFLEKILEIGRMRTQLS